MAPQDDLTAERAATDMYNRLFSVMRLPEHEHHAKARLKLFYQVTRQEALREAARQARFGAMELRAMNEPLGTDQRGYGQKALQDFADILDRLASEGG